MHKSIPTTTYDPYDELRKYIRDEVRESIYAELRECGITDDWVYARVEELGQLQYNDPEHISELRSFPLEDVIAALEERTHGAAATPAAKP